VGVRVLRHVVDDDAQRAVGLHSRGRSGRFDRKLLVALVESIDMAGVEALVGMEFMDTHSFTS